MRYALWVQGCSIRCAGCCNPEMFSDRSGDEIDVAVLVEEIAAERGLEGITLLGGEPFEQAAPLTQLARAVRATGLTVMTFTGYVREDLQRGAAPDHLALLEATDLLADGPFVAAASGSRFRWLGSQNQRLHTLTDRYSLDDPRFYAPNTIDIRIERGRIEVSGWAPLAMSLMRERGVAFESRRSQARESVRDLCEAGAHCMIGDEARANGELTEVAPDIRDGERDAERGECGCVVAAVADEAGEP